jgi:MoaA/NifB/PqqE/SkfB family radical SAM enzyme/glycosyltransferase involved in cell wall biosynthesis/predicted O-methyltransferase YrrM
MIQNNPYDSSFYDEQRDASLASAEVIVPIILEHLTVTSVVDIGCSTESWLSVFAKSGVTDISGFDCNNLTEGEYVVNKSLIRTEFDISSLAFPHRMAKDLALCLEVAEHLPETAADDLVTMLVSAAPVVIFSAAFPGQTGFNHINEHPPWYWREKFNNHGYAEIDFIRPFIWKDERIGWWYRQNITCYANIQEIGARQELLKLASRFLQKEGPHTLTIVNEWILKESGHADVPFAGISAERFSRLLIHACTIQTSLTAEEKATLFDLARKTRGISFVEIGSYVGASASLLALAFASMSSSAKVYCVDTWNNEGMSEGVRDTYGEFLQNTRELADYLIPLRGASGDIASRFHGQADFLFINGEHLYEGLATYIVSWFPKLRPGSVVVFHDICWAEGVQRAFTELALPFLEDVTSLSNMRWGRFKAELPPFSDFASTPLKLHFQDYYQKNSNPQALAEEIQSTGIPFEQRHIDVDDFETWLSEFQNLKELYAAHGDVMIEKCLEHYLAYRVMDLKPGSRYIDVAAAGSNWHEILRKKGIEAYALDIVYPKGVTGWHIGADASATGLPDGFAAALSLQCAYETFEGNADAQFILEASRILHEGGSLVITPLYLEEQHIVISSPDTDLNRHTPDEGALRVWRTDTYQAAFSRHYSVSAFVWRLGDALSGLNYKVIRYTNLEELRVRYPGQRIYCDFLLEARKATHNQWSEKGTPSATINQGGLYHLSTATLYITKRCNSRCATCYLWKTKDASTELSCEKWQYSIAKLKACGIENIWFSGGECLLRDDIHRLIEAAKIHDFKSIGLTTNGLLLNEKIIDDLILSGANSFQISLDGLSSLYSELRGVDCADRVMNNIRLLTSKKVSVQILTNLSQINIDDLVGIAQFASSVGAKWFPNLLNFIEWGFSNVPSDKVEVKPDQIKPLAHKLVTILYGYSSICSFDEYDVKYIYHHLRRDEIISKIPCNTGQNSVYITEDGNIYSACRSIESVGNIVDDDIHQVLNSEKYKQNIRRMSSRECPGCTCGYSNLAHSKHFKNFASIDLRTYLKMISVVIPTRNRATLLSDALKSLLSQTYPQNLFEILIIDNDSTDDTPEVCKAYQHRFKNFRYLHTDEPGLHVGRNAGLKHAGGEILVYGDDDIRAMDTWLEGIAESFLENDVAMVTGKILPNFETSPPTWIQSLAKPLEDGWALGWYTLLDFGDETKPIPHEYVWGANFAIRKDILRQVGGFHPDSFPQELIKYRGDGETAVSLAVRDLGYKAVYNPRASVYHLVSQQRLTREYLYQRAYNQGISDSYSSIRKNRSFSEARQYKSPSNSIHDVVDRGFVDGFNYHQQLTESDESLLTWVLKDTYIDSGEQCP